MHSLAHLSCLQIRGYCVCVCVRVSVCVFSWLFTKNCESFQHFEIVKSIKSNVKATSKTCSLSCSLDTLVITSHFFVSFFFFIYIFTLLCKHTYFKLPESLCHKHLFVRRCSLFDISVSLGVRHVAAGFNSCGLHGTNVFPVGSHQRFNIWGQEDQLSGSVLLSRDWPPWAASTPSYHVAAVRLHSLGFVRAETTAIKAFQIWLMRFVFILFGGFFGSDCKAELRLCPSNTNYRSAQLMSRCYANHNQPMDFPLKDDGHL